MNDKKNRRNVAYADFFIKYGKWILLAIFLIAVWAGRHQFADIMSRFTNWDEYVANRGDRLLTQHLFVADRLYIEDPAEYSDVTQLENGTFSYNVREGADLTLIQQKVELSNGDVFRHVTIPYAEFMKMSSVDTLKFILRYRFTDPTAYYYDWTADSWVELDKIKGGTSIPADTLIYIDFGGQYYVLMDHLYAYDIVEDGIRRINTELEKTTYFNVSASGGWELLTAFYPREESEYQFWSLESTKPLVDVDSEESIFAGEDGPTSKEFLLKELGLGKTCRWLEDGYYVPMTEDQSPYTEDSLYRAPAQEGLPHLLLAGGLPEEPELRGAGDLAFAQAIIASQAISDSGYYAAPVQDERLYAEYGIKYGYMDVQANAEFGMALVSAWGLYEEPVFQEKLGHLAEFLADYCDSYGISVSGGGLAVPAYWQEKGGIAASETSAECCDALGNFLQFAGLALDSGEYMDLGEQLLDGAQAIANGAKAAF